jgi:uncharacterized membrane protein YvbJ
MFCPHCGKQNLDNLVFCAFCGKEMTQTSSAQPPVKAEKASAPKARLSFTAIKAIVTILLLGGLILAILQIYYPSILPWNW